MLKIDEEDNIYLTRGDTAIIDIALFDEDGDPYAMLSSDRLVFTLRKLYDKGVILIEKEVDEPSFSFTSSDTKDLDFGAYVYDIYLKNIGKIDTFIAEKTFTIGEEAHDFE